jgi:hypothetical protein
MAEHMAEPTTQQRKRSGWVWVAAILVLLGVAVGANEWNDYQQQRNVDRLVEDVCPDC